MFTFNNRFIKKNLSNGNTKICLSWLVKRAAANALVKRAAANAGGDAFTSTYQQNLYITFSD